MFYRRLRRIDSQSKMQLIGLVLVIAGWIASSLHLPELLAALTAFSGALVLAKSFADWAWPQIQTAWNHSGWKLLFLVLNLAVIWLATVFSRSVVAGAVGLPVEYLRMTTSFFVFALYLPAALLIGYLLSAACGVVFGLVAMVKDRNVLKYVGLTFGSLALSVLCGVGVTLVAQNEARFYPLARHVAYLADFEPAAAYPGVLSTERIVLMDGGRMATAARHKAGFVFAVRSVETAR